MRWALLALLLIAAVSAGAWGGLSHLRYFDIKGCALPFRRVG